MDFDRDGHVTFARELWQPDRVNFGHFYGVDFGKFWPANSHKFPWFAGNKTYSVGDGIPTKNGWRRWPMRSQLPQGQLATAPGLVLTQLLIHKCRSLMFVHLGI